MNKPKYKCGDIVQFIVSDRTQIGTIRVVDRYGTFEQNEQPSYDIMVDNWFGSGEKMFCKHVVESLVQRKFKSNEMTIVTDNKGITFSNDKIPFYVENMEG